MPFRIQEHTPLSPRTTLGIGGPARYFVEAAAETEVVDALDFAAGKNLSLFVLGGGSNLLIADRGFPGLVLKIAVPGIALEPEGDRVLVRAGAGEDWDAVVQRAVDRDLAGIECLSGIPGSAGGTPVQNVGAYGQEVSDVVMSVRVFDLKTQQTHELAREACGFAYRRSIFNSVDVGRYIVLGVTYALRTGEPAALRYPDLARRFAASGRPPTVQNVRQAVREIRASKGMLLAADDPDSRSAGSFFKNPVLDAQALKALQMIAPDAPRYAAAGGTVKTSAAWLIEHTGFSKGYSRGPVAISTKHTLALVNRGNATAADVLTLAREIRNRVEDRFGVRLVPEPVFVGFDEY